MKQRTNYKAFQGSKVLKNVEVSPEITKDKTQNVIGRTTSKVYLRKGPSKSEDDITVLSENDQVSILSGLNDNTDWYQVCTSFGREGYVMKEFVEIKDV